MVQRTALSSAEPDIRSAVTIRVAAQITLFGRGTGGHAADHVGTHNVGWWDGVYLGGWVSSGQASAGSFSW